MLNIFSLDGGRLAGLELEAFDRPGHEQLRPIWVDLEDPSPEDKAWVASHFGLTIPEDAIDDDLEESARFYEEDDGRLHIRSDFLRLDDEGQSRNVRVAFILAGGVLVSIRKEDLPVFRLLRMRARRIPALIEDAKDVLLKLYDADAEYSADALEGIYDALNAISARVLRRTGRRQTASEVLAAIARQEDLNGRIRRNVMDTRRAVSFMMRSRMLNSRAVRRLAPDPARHRVAGQPHGLSVRQDQLPDGRHGRFHQHQPEQDHQDLLGGRWRCCRRR
jgi:magnesium transporter